MKKIVVVLCILAFLFTCGCSGKYQRVAFYSSGELGNDQISSIWENTVKPSTKFENTASKNEKIVSNLPVYEITPHNIDKQEFENMAKSLGIFDYVDNSEYRYEYPGILKNSNSKNGGNVKVYKNGHNDGYYLSAHTTGNFFFYTRAANHKQELTTSNEELISQAEEVFEKLLGKNHGYVCVGPTSRETTDNVVTAKILTFVRLVENRRVLGDDSAYVEFDADGLRTVLIYMYDYTLTQKRIDVVSFEKALELSKTNPDSIYMPDYTSKFNNKTADLYKVTNVYLHWYNQNSSGCTILQPIYYFDGILQSGDVSIEVTTRVVAIPERYTYVAKETS